MGTDAETDAILRSRDVILLWDFDGTIADTREDIAQAVRALLTDRGLPPMNTDAIIACTGLGVDVLLRRCMEHSGAPLRNDDDLKDALKFFRAYYTDHMTDHTKAYPGLDLLLLRLKETGRIMAVVSNKTEAMTVAVAERLGVADCFKVILGGDSIGVRKPDPGPILHALEVCSPGMRPGQAVMIGDTMTDYRSARAARVPVCLVGYGFEPAEKLMAAEPDWLMETPGDLSDALLPPTPRS